MPRKSVKKEYNRVSVKKERDVSVKQEYDSEEDDSSEFDSEDDDFDSKRFLTKTYNRKRRSLDPETIRLDKLRKKMTAMEKKVGILIGLLEGKNGECGTFVFESAKNRRVLFLPTHVANLKFPQQIIEFYQQRLVFRETPLTF